MADEIKGTPLDYAVLLMYFVVVVGFGLWFGRYTRTTKDFFYGGQRFSWWLISISCVATLVGSYSFTKYSDAGFAYGLSSTQTYLNEWFWIPMLLLMWLPFIYFGRIQSVPEYFERRFGVASRHAATALILVYLIGYVGINLYTLGQTLESLLGWPVMMGAFVTALIVMLYMFAGGQTSVIMTDLLQGIILLVAGIGLLFAGIAYVGGFGNFWELLPHDHKYLFSEFAQPDEFSFIGIYAQDGLANTAAFVLMNQGVLMRFLSMKSVQDGRRMAICWVLILGPLAAIAVSSGGWVARVLVESGAIETEAKHAFVDAAYFLSRPGIFGFVLAALTAALMSTTDTLVTAVSSIVLNDIYRPYLRPNRQDKHYLVVARITSTITVFTGLALVLVFMRSDSIYQAHGRFTAAVTPPIVVALIMGVMWARYTPAAAVATMIGGSVLVAASFQWPEVLVRPFSFGMGPDSYGFMRALYGLVVCSAIGVGVSFVTRPRELSAIKGLVNGTQLDAMRAFKGGEPNRAEGRPVRLRLRVDSALGNEYVAIVPNDALDTMAARPGDLLYACDTRWWFGGLRSVHVRASSDTPASGEVVLSPEAAIDAHFEDGQIVRVEKIF